MTKMLRVGALASTFLVSTAVLAADLPRNGRLPSSPATTTTQSPVFSSAPTNALKGPYDENFTRVSIDAGIGFNLMTRQEEKEFGSAKKDDDKFGFQGGIGAEYVFVTGNNFFGGIGAKLRLENIYQTRSITDGTTVLNIVKSFDSAKMDAGTAADAKITLDKSADAFLQAGFASNNFMVGIRGGVSIANAEFSFSANGTKGTGSSKTDVTFSPEKASNTIVWGPMVGVFASYALTDTIDLGIGYSYSHYLSGNLGSDWKEKMKDVTGGPKGDKIFDMGLAVHRASVSFGMRF